MFDSMSSSAGLAGLTILCLAALIGGIMLTQVIAWAPTWEAWLAADPPNGGGFEGGYVSVLNQLPVWLIVFEILVVIALASPVAIRLRR